MTEPLLIEKQDQITVWRVDRPDARNAINDAMASALERALSDAENDLALRALVLTGTGNAAFISGADLKFLRSAPASERAAMDARVLDLMVRLEQLPIPVIAALNGPVVGGGMEIALACDMRIAEPHVTMTFKHAAMGVTPGWGGFARLAATVGRSTAARLLLTALPLPVEHALRVGLVDEVAPAGTAFERALEIARAVTLTSPGTVRELKRLLHIAYRGELSLAEEQRVFLASTKSADHSEALGAFFEKRSPRFQPR